MPARRLLILLTVLLFGPLVRAQHLKSGFDVAEYLGVLQRGSAHFDAPFRGTVPPEKGFLKVYRSPVVGLHNKFDIWADKNTATIAIDFRGTTSDMDSWLENFYSAMIPAVGSIQLSDTNTFTYKLARDPKAMVHVGWTIGLGSMAPLLLRNVQQHYALGYKNIIVEGHSQGGALAYLVSAWLYYLREEGKVPADLVIKTYCSAAPKPGNLYFAYDYDFNNRGGWAFNVVNTADWVPETPFAAMTVTDFNKLNPFSNTRQFLSGQKFIVRAYTNMVYSKLDKKSRKTQQKFEKYTGRKAYKLVRKYMPQLRQPIYTNSINYTRAGTAVVLQPNEDYYKKFPDTGRSLFRHHLFESYYYLVQQVYK